LRHLLILIAAILTVALATVEAYAQKKYSCTNTCVGPPGARSCTRSCY